jgi:hypothetical protein
MTTYDASTVTYDASNLTYQGLPAQFDGIAFAVEMAFGYPPLDTNPSWEAVTPYVREIRIDRGKRSEYITQSPGVLQILLDNRDRRFDPDNAAGPYYNDLVPMVPVRVQATYLGTTWTLFQGFAQGWPSISQTANTDPVSLVNAIDATRLLANTILPIEYEYLVSSDPSLAFYLPMQTWEPFVTVQGGNGTGLLDYTKSTYFPRKNETFPTFTEESAPIQTNQGFRHDTSLDPTPTHTSNRHFLQAIGRTPAIFTGEQDAFITGSMRTLEFWLYSVDATRWWVYTDEPVFVINYRAPTGSYDSKISFSVNDDGTLSQIEFLTADGERDHTLSTTVDLVPQDANHIVMTADSTNVMIYVNGTQVYNEPYNNPAVAGVFAGPYSLMNIYTYVSRMSHVAVYYDTFDAAKVAEHYAAGYGYVGELTSTRLNRALDDAAWPAAFRDIETGVQTVGAYRAGDSPVADYFVEINNAEQGQLFVDRENAVTFRSRTTTDITNIAGSFDDNGTDGPFSDVIVDGNTIDAIYNNVEGNYSGGTVTATDAASVVAYGRSTQYLDLGLVDDKAAAQSIVDVRLSRSKDPRTRISRLQIPVRRSPADLVPIVAPLDLNDDVTVSFTPGGVGSPLWRAVRVQGLSHTITLDRWDVSLYLSPGPINTNGPLLVLDDDTYGELDNNKLG